MEANVVIHMHELLQAADLDGIKTFYDDLQARISSGKMLPLSENVAKKLHQDAYCFSYLPHLELDCEAEEFFLPLR